MYGPRKLRCTFIDCRLVQVGRTPLLILSTFSFAIFFRYSIGTVPCHKRNGPLPKEERSPAKRGMVPCQKRNMVPCQNDVPTFRDLEVCMRASRLAASSRRRACATCGLLLLHFLLNLVLWVPRPRPTTKRAANSLRNLIIWVGALAHEGATRVEGILNQKSQV